MAEAVSSAGSIGGWELDGGTDSKGGAVSVCSTEFLGGTDGVGGVDLMGGRALVGDTDCTAAYAVTSGTGRVTRACSRAYTHSYVRGA